MNEKKKVSEVLKSYNTKPQNYWQSKQGVFTLKLFKKMAKQVRGYQQHLKNNKIKQNLIKRSANLVNVTPVSKNNYFRRYPFQSLFWSHIQQRQNFILTATSGSSGEPTYFPRTQNIDWQYSLLAEFFLQNGPRVPTLLLDCFGMGVWIGGVITYQAFYGAAARGFPINILTPGVNKKEIFHALKHLAPNYKQIIIAGYPPFIKDLLDEAIDSGISFKNIQVRLLFAAESFTESFRDYVSKKVGITNAYLNTLNIYGSAELGAMAFETPFAILIRRLALQEPKLAQELFGTLRTPTLAQFDPNFINFEAEEGKILISANNATPFLRYDIGDTGGVLKLSDIVALFSKYKVNLLYKARKLKISTIALPFVYVYERSDFSTKLYGAIMYPEHIKEVLISPKLNKFFTGKCTMETVSDNRHNQELILHLELKGKLKPNPKLIQDLVIKNLLKRNSEYKNNYDSIPHKIKPRINFWAYNHPEYFSGQGKQKWVKQ